MHDPAPRILFIGLDAAEPTLLRRWAADGTLPNFTTLFDSAAAWTLPWPDVDSRV